MEAVRPALPEDAEGILAIYGPYVRDSCISFEYEVPTLATMQERLQHGMWLVARDENRVVGYAAATRHRERAAYQWSCDVAVYVHPEWHSRGVARSLYTDLFRRLKEQGYFNAFAGIALPNGPSICLHESFGFWPIGVYHSVGFKFGKWHDVAWWQKELQPATTAPEKPGNFSAPHS